MSLFTPLRLTPLQYFSLPQESESTNYGHGDDLVLLLSDSGLDSEAKLRTSDLMLAAWTNFAKAASPNPPNHRPTNHTAAGQEKVHTAKKQYGKFEINISRKGIARLGPNFHIQVSVSDLYTVFPPSVSLFCCRKILYVDRS
jgi:hypothetical protein